jgi:hypothetical protein
MRISSIKNKCYKKNIHIKVKWSKIGVLINAVMLGISLLFVLYIVHASWAPLKIYFKHLNYWLLALALLIYPLGFLPLLMMWHKIMSYIGGCHDLYTNIRLYSLSCLPKRLPGTVWYISSRVATYHECQVKPAITLMATFIETICLTFSGFSISLLVGTTSALFPQGKGLAICLFLLSLAFLIWVLLARRRFWSKGRTDKFNLRSTLLLLGISALAWIGGGLLLYILSNAVTKVPINRLPSLIGIWSGAGALSLSIGLLAQGLGLREMALTALLAYEMPLPAAVIVSLLFRLLLTLGEPLWALVAAWLAHKASQIMLRDY